MHIVTLATCHNRRVKTLSALSDLHAQKLPRSVTVEHVLVDDGSTDGTTKAVGKQFPNVEIVQGTGDLFWAGGMRHGWEVVSGKTFDALFVYNDDVHLEKDALLRLIETSQQFIRDGGVAGHAVVGAFRSDDAFMSTSYSGAVRSSWWHPLRFKRVHPPVLGYKQVDTLNMNAALIRHAALTKVGFLSDYFVHRGADFEFGIKLNKSGGAVILASNYIGVCNRNQYENNFLNHCPTLYDCYCWLLDIRREPIRQRMKYYREHGGLFWPLLWIAPYISLPIKYFALKTFDK